MGKSSIVWWLIVHIIKIHLSTTVFHFIYPLHLFLFLSYPFLFLLISFILFLHFLSCDLLLSSLFFFLLHL